MSNLFFSHFHYNQKNILHVNLRFKNNTDKLLQMITHKISLQQIKGNRSVEQHLNEATSIVIYSPVNSRLNAISNQQSPASCVATYTISGNVPISTETASSGNDQDDSPLLSFCSVTNTLLNQ